MGIAGKLEDDMEDLSEINLTPFIDVILVLLIIFMVAAQTSAVSQDVNLPSSKADTLIKPKPITVTVKANGSFVVGNHIVAPSGLREALLAVHAMHDDRILLLGDQTLTYQSLMDAFDALRAAGYFQVGLVGRGAQQPK